MIPDSIKAQILDPSLDIVCFGAYKDTRPVDLIKSLLFGVSSETECFIGPLSWSLSSFVSRLLL